MNYYPPGSGPPAIRARRLTQRLLLALALVTGASPAVLQPQISNAAPQWPSLEQVLKTWDETPVEEVKRAAEKGDLTAQHYLGFCYSEGKRVTRDAKAAATWYERAGTAGYMPSFNNLGVLYQQGGLLPRDPEKAFGFYRRAAEGGFAVSQLNLGYAYHDGLGVQRDLDAAARWFLKAAENGQPAAMRELYLSFQDGFGSVTSPSEAGQWLKRASDDGDAYAECLLGYSYENPNPEDRSARPRLREAVELYRLSARQNWPGGLYHLALCCLKGKGVARDEEQGLELMRRAADQGHASALAGLAELYARGIGEPRSSEERPLQLLLRADKAGSLPREDRAQIRAAISFRYRHGLGTDRDLMAAALWYGLTGILDPSHYPLKGKLLADDKLQRTAPFEASLSLLLKAATPRDSAALYEIGTRYDSGKNAPNNPGLAWCWLTLAAQKGAPQASARISDLESRMSSRELASARLNLQVLTHQLDEIAQAIQTLNKSAG
jgi:TPR repeat protein